MHLQRADGKLKSFTARPPRLSSDDAFLSDVGWKAQIQRRGPSGSTWKTIYTSSVQHGAAKEGTWADFTKRTFSPAFPSDADPFFTDYRVVMMMLQFYGDGSVAGKATHLVDYYYNGQSEDVSGPGGWCSRKVGNF